MNVGSIMQVENVGGSKGVADSNLQIRNLGRWVRTLGVKPSYEVYKRVDLERIGMRERGATMKIKAWVLVLVLYCVCLANSVLGMARVGGISDVSGSENSLEIENLARFAVNEHNKKQNTLLEFNGVVKARQQVVAGTMYYITLEATDGGKKKTYEAKIWVKPWMNFQELQEFKPVGDETANACS